MIYRIFVEKKDNLHAKKVKEEAKTKLMKAIEASGKTPEEIIELLNN